MTTWLKSDLERMLKQLNASSKLSYEFDIAYGGYRLETVGGSHTITKNKRYSKSGMGQFLSDLLEYKDYDRRGKN